MMGDDEPSGLTIADALREAASELRKSGVADARREAGSLLTHATALDRTRLITRADEELSAGQLAAFRSAVARRASGEPLQYIRGVQEFYGLEFEVTPDVLIPRPETELLVETALELLRDTPSPSVCDVGTGSGCVLVSLLHTRRDARGFGLDVSPAALRVAERNAERNGVTVNERAWFAVSDCFDVWDDTDAPPRFDLIASNPPYIAESDMEGLQREVRDHEPRGALTPGGDGLSVIRRLLKDAPRVLKTNGHLVIEIGYDQHERVAALVDANVWTPLGIRKDLQGIPRTVALRLNE